MRLDLLLSRENFLVNTTNPRLSRARVCVVGVERVMDAWHAVGCRNNTPFGVVVLALLVTADAGWCWWLWVWVAWLCVG